WIAVRLRIVCFFFQAEDGIRARTVTGVQTCALPICAFARRCPTSAGMRAGSPPALMPAEVGHRLAIARAAQSRVGVVEAGQFERSEERRVGKGGRCWGWGWLWRGKAVSAEWCVGEEV